jgi:hypothetical protein
MKTKSLAVTLIPYAVVAAFAVAIYAYVLPLPFFRDDMVMLLWLRDMSWERLWVDATGFPYYRPLSFSTLKLSELVFGWPEPISLHVLNLALHSANSVMVALLAGRFFDGRGKRIAAISAGLLFAAYPFTYEIIPTTGPIFQLQAAFFGLGAALAYANFRSQHSPQVREIQNLQSLSSGLKSGKWLVVSLLLALLGAFTCEYGVIIPAFVLTVEVMLWWKNRPTMNRRATHIKPAEGGYRFSCIPLAYFIFSAIYLALWVVVPKSRAEVPLMLQGLAAAFKNMPVTGLYYLQGLTYPFQTLAWPLVRATGASNQLAVGLIAAMTLMVIVTLFVRARRLPLLVFALAWFLIAIAPMWPTLNADYTLNGPRLHYLPSMATSLIWASIIAILTTDRGRRTVVSGLPALAVRPGPSAVGLILLTAALAQSLWFLYGMADMITIGARTTADVSHAIAATPPDEPTLVINFPSWIGRRKTETTFALGEEGISFLPGYSTMREMVRLNTRQDRNVQQVTFTNTIKEWKYDQRLGLLVNWNKLVKAVRAAKLVWAVEYLPDKLQLREAGASLGAAATGAPSVTFDEQLGVRPISTMLTGQGLRVELAWTTVITVDRQLTAFIHVYNGQGQLAAQQDGYPLLGNYPPWQTQVDETVRDVRHVPLPRLPAGHYGVGLGMYDAETGQRAAALARTGERLENDVYLIYEFDIR